MTVVSGIDFSVLYSVIISLVIPLLLHTLLGLYANMLNTTFASITLRSLCLVLVLVFKYSYGALHIWHLN